MLINDKLGASSGQALDVADWLESSEANNCLISRASPATGRVIPRQLPCIELKWNPAPVNDIYEYCSSLTTRMQHARR